MVYFIPGDQSKTKLTSISSHSLNARLSYTWLRARNVVRGLLGWRKQPLVVRNMLPDD